MNRLFDSWRALRRRSSVRAALFLALLMLLAFAGLTSIQTGAAELDLPFIVRATSDEFRVTLGLTEPESVLPEERIERINTLTLIQIRWPRLLLAGFVGMGLGVAGAALQGVFRNPLADPGLIGVTGGAAVGAVTAILLGIESRLTVVILAFSGGLVVTGLVYRLAYQGKNYGGRRDDAAILLVGLAVNAMSTAYVGMATYIAGQEQIGDITFWTLGSVATAFWVDVHHVAAVTLTLAGVLMLPPLGQRLNLLALGDSEARYLGVRVEALRVLVMGLCAVLVGVGVAFAGIIGLVGLVVPQMMRLLFGSDHRLLLPASALGGAAFLMTADIFARTLAETSEIPLGVLTTLVGGPVFLILLLRR